MAKYIELEALIGDLTAAMDHRGMGQVIGQTLIRYVKRQPAADVAPVVRCKDCAHLYGTFCMVCGLLRRKPDDFCSRGERKDGAGYGKEEI